MESPPFKDKRVSEAAEILRKGETKLLSLDVFDTLLARRVPNPPDVFLRMGTVLESKGKLCNGQGPDSFAAIRYQTEYARRAIRQKAHEDREITLTEIYELFPKHIVDASLSVQDMVDLEVQTESELAFCNDDIVGLAKLAKSLGIKLALISNTYLHEKDFSALIHDKAQSFPQPDAVFVSGERRMGKRTGLLHAMCFHFGFVPSQVLHIGDNPISDILACKEAGIPCLDYGVYPADLPTLLTDEHPRQWIDRTSCFAKRGGDLGLAWLRRQSSHWQPPSSIAPKNYPYYLYGTQHIGPLLTGFAAWVTERLKQEHTTCVFGLMREGETLARLVQTINPKQQTACAAVNRLTAALACFTPDTQDYLEDFLTRRGFWTIEMLMAQLGFTRDQAKTIDDPERSLEAITPRELTKRLIQSPLAAQLYDNSAKRRTALIKHLQTIGALDHERLFLLDLGYAATIQRGLQRVFHIERKPITTHGLYLATAHVSLGTQLAGGIVEGFLAQNGNPNDFACAFCRSPELVELSCMPPCGTVIGYDENGNPSFEDNSTPQRQLDEVATVQQGIFDFARAFCDLNPPTDDISSLCLSDAWRKQLRAIALRIVAHPTADEAHLLGHWLADSDMGLTSPRPIVSAGLHQDKLHQLSAVELAALPRRDVPWLFGVAATLSYAHCRQVARLIMRHEKVNAFKT